MNTTSYTADVLIVGAGLAGSTLGFLLRQSGKDVLAVELRDADEKDKLCAGLLTPGSVKLFSEIYGPSALKGLSPFPLSRGCFRFLGSMTSGAVDYRSLPRKQLDDCCTQGFLAAGGRIVDRSNLVGIDETNRIATFMDLRKGESFEVSYGTLVGADGASSAVRRLLSGRKQRICPSVQGTVPFRGSELVFEYRLQDLGYCWYIPHADDATVGCMLHGATAADCRERTAEFCAELGIDVPPLRGAPIPEGDDVLLRAGEAYLVGDAAGLIDAFGGGGIWYALSSAHALAGALTGGTPYERAMERQVADVERISSTMSGMFFRTCFGIALHSSGSGSRSGA